MNTRQKYPRTLHMSFSLGRSNDDKVLDNLNHFIGKEVIITEKMDGECLQSKTKIRMIDDSVLHKVRDL